MKKLAPPSFFHVLRQTNSRRRTSIEAGREWRVGITILLLIAGIVLGGGGTSNPLTEVMLQLVALALVAAWAFAPGVAPRNPSGWVTTLGLLVLAVPAAQLVPLPPQLWHMLPGREVEIASLTLIGRENAWMPWTVAPALTLAVLLAMIPGLIMMWFVASLDEPAKDRLLLAVAGMALASVVLGTLQLAAPSGRTPTFYDYVHQGFVIGFQANKNAEVDLLLIGLLALAAHYARPQPRARKQALALAYAAAALVLLAGAILTGSRAGILLVPAAVVLALFTLPPKGLAARRTMIAVVAVAFLAIGTAWMLRDNAVLGRVALRFATDRDFRSELWTDTIFAIGQYWPFGGGMGTFTQLMTPVERLEVLDVTLPSRAHNDYLELLLESGIFGPLVIVAIIGCVGLMLRRSSQYGTLPRPHKLFALAAFFVIAAHSLVDYPMRSMSLAILAGMAAGLVVPPRAERDVATDQQRAPGK
ncbi:MAG: hypothetical protein RIS94_784 [Pseudomonadota bacterium]|jgi:O-antigen ligase